MANIRIPCLVAKRNKSGLVNWYWQPSKTLADAGWKTLALGKDEGAAIAAARQRNEEVALWKMGGGKPGEVRKREIRGTLGGLIERYRREVLASRRHDGSRQVGAKTAESYQTALRRIDAWAGKHPLAYVTPARVRVLRDVLVRPVDQGGIGHAAAFNMLKMLRQLFNFAISVDLMPKGSNPATDFGLGAPAPRRQVWEADDEGAFIAAAYDLGLPSMALAIRLAIYTAQREGDLIGFTEHQFQQIPLFDPALIERLAGDDGEVMGWVFTQRKTGMPMAIPFDPAMRAEIEAALRHNRAIDRRNKRLVTHLLVNDRTGLPWQKRHFIRTWSAIIDHAVAMTGRTGMRELVWHDLRRTRVVRLRRRNVPKEAIATLTGTKPRTIDAMLDAYGPIDATMTAAVIAGSLDTEARAEAASAARRSSQQD